jgi:hypothetical protein
MTFLLSNWKLVLIGLLIIATGLFYKLWREEVRSFAVFKAQVETLGKAAQVEKERIEREHSKITKEIKDAIQKKVAAARTNAVANYIASLPVDSGSCGVSGTSNSPDGTNAAGEERMVASTGFIQDCAQDAATIGLWQEWASWVGFPVK